MTNEQIIEGLRLALSRGYSLEQSMMSFYNAGYKKEDIEEAARALSTHPEHSLSHPEKEIPEYLKKQITKPLPTQKQMPSISSSPVVKGTEKQVEPIKKEEEEERKKISKYEEKTKPKGKLITILLIIFLFIILGTIAGIFIFKEELINIFARL